MRNAWTKKKIIEEIIAFYRLNKRFPTCKEKGQEKMYSSCYFHLGGLGPAIRMAKIEVRKQEGDSPFRVPCGELDAFFTKCGHKRACANGDRCPIAVNGSGHPQAAMNMTKTEFI